MVRRCHGTSNNPNDRQYSRIKVHPAWKTSFHLFMREMGPRPSSEHTLDRYPRKSGDYVPGNVRWADRSEQAVNRKSTRFLTYKGETLPTSHWAKKFGMSRSALVNRLKKGWSLDKALSELPAASGFAKGLRMGKKLTLSEVKLLLREARSGKYTMADLARRFGIGATSVLNITRRFNVQVMKRYSKVLTRKVA